MSSPFGRMLVFRATSRQIYRLKLHASKKPVRICGHSVHERTLCTIPNPAAHHRTQFTARLFSAWRGARELAGGAALSAPGHATAGRAFTDKPLSAEESDWAKLIASKVPAWAEMIDSLRVPFADTIPPDSATILLGNQGAEDAFCIGMPPCASTCSACSMFTATPRNRPILTASTVFCT